MTKPISVWRPVDTGRFLLGAAHYPEHGERGQMAADAARMAEAGFNTIRLAEFAWSLMEPREGVFDFALFDEAIGTFAGHGIQTILCTPTATPPRWLTCRYPEVLRVDGNGRPDRHGSRQHADTTSPVYRAHSRRITRAMAGHYAVNPHVIGWQTDNELNHSASTSYSESAARGFRLYLAGRYEGDIARLNAAWGGDVWSTGYDSFDQVDLPHAMAPVSPGPGHVLDYHRFLARATAQFQRDQVEILRAANADWFIYHNVGRMNDLDFRGDFGRDLDFMGYDVYPLLQDERLRTGSAGHAQAWHLDTARSHTGNFLVPEQMSGPGSQAPFATLTPEPGEMRRMAYSSIARGADGIVFFRWRTARSGPEICWGGILDQDDIPRRRYAEAQAFAAEIPRLQDRLSGTHVHMEIGIAGADFDNQEAHAAYSTGLPGPAEAALALHRHCYRRGYGAGMIHPEDDLTPLKLLFVPHWTIWKAGWTAAVAAWVKAGGTLVLGARTGSRTPENQVITSPAPGPELALLAGVRVEEFGRLPPERGPGLSVAPDGARYMSMARPNPAVSAGRCYRLRFGGEEHPAAHLYEALTLSNGATALGTWSSGFLTGQVAVSSRRHGHGRVIYVGTYLTESLIPAFEREIIARAGISPLLPDLPEGVEVSLRTGAEARLLFVLNTASEPRRVPGLPEGAVLIGDGAAVGREVTLPPHGCHILDLPGRR